VSYIAHQMTITPVGSGGTVTGLYHVYCLTCDQTVHKATQVPAMRIEKHLATCVDCGHVGTPGAYGYKPHNCKGAP
jgi:hypothetical protein